MKAIIIGILIIAAAVFTILPADIAGFGLGWGSDVLVFLKGGVPVLAVLVGVIAVFIGIADIKDRAEAKKEDFEKKDSQANNE